MTTLERPMRILVGVDGSDASMGSIELLKRIDWPADSTFDIVTVVQPVAPIAAGPWALAAPPWTSLSTSHATELETEFQRQAGALVEATKVRLAQPARRFETAVLSGRTAVSILDRAHTTDADLIVVGSRGHSAIRTMLLGSVSAEIIDHAECGVLVARGPGMDRVILAVDGSQAADDAARLVSEWSIFRDTKVLAVSVAPLPPPWWTGLDDMAVPTAVDAFDDITGVSHDIHERLATETARQLRQHGIAAESMRREGDPAPEILEAANEWHADLIVMGTRGRTGVRRAMLGSVARNVLTHAPCSVMVCRMASSDQPGPDMSPV
jgi:nucleotide-binding universal stress UspA family protein